MQNLHLGQKFNMINKNLYVIQDVDNENLIKFFLARQDLNADLEVINKYNFIEYKGLVIIDNGIVIPKGTYHKIEFYLVDLKSEFLKDKIKNFIEDTFNEYVNSEDEFINLLKNLINFFSNAKKSEEIKFIENSFSFLIFLNWCLENDLINEDFLINFYNDETEDFEKIFINENYELIIKNSKNLKIMYEDDKNIADYLTISYRKANKEESINLLELLDKLISKGIKYSNKFLTLKEKIESIGEEEIEKIKIDNLNNIELYFYNHNDLPEIQVNNLNKCKSISLGMDYSLCSCLESEKESMKELLKKLFSSNDK